MARINNKIKAIEELSALREASKKEGKNIVMAGGVFDLFHYGHLRHLQTAKDEGDILVVVVTADAYAGKAPGRPVFSENMRAEIGQIATNEMVVTLEDFLRRRTRMALLFSRKTLQDSKSLHDLNVWGNPVGK